ncbi:MAG: SDR family NAD(P)-dependent oxidoreductase [Desulfobacula sp.]|uniref:SDR family NAD(P)-dependent oxidoreductase n=1 Tax=Desulfobacula sp. TaxID=2593537 RepID=UPI0025C29D5A|nr:SDR family NAD(P)-dependent oxidoreductase [Desulfobacula sp.]MCD4720415.1 SDR family NAD(P)-dependent oxidoreductase [Desulfobacula sp.]
MKQFLKQKRILITGACGTIGSELTRQLLEDYNALEVVGIDNNESELFFLEQKYLKHDNTKFALADIRDCEKLIRMMQDIDIVFHTAALKHVVLCERNPFEAIQTNILGVKNIINAASACNVKRVIFTSSDKAVNPTNVMGTSKLMGERIFTAANSNQRDATTIFASTRFGNVLGSRGSVIPIFKEQIKKGGPVTLTDPEMTRFIMSIKDAVQLVIDSAKIALGGFVFITKMPVIRIKDLAEVMIEDLAPVFGHNPKDIDMKIIGTKPGEKLYEELMSQEETRRALELKNYFAVKPAFESLYNKADYTYNDIVSDMVSNPYNSANESKLTKEELRNFLLTNKLLEECLDASHPDERYWP